MLGKSSVSDLSEHVFDLIQELFAIDPHLLLSVMPQLEFKLKVRVSINVNPFILSKNMSHSKSKFSINFLSHTFKELELFILSK